jgi:hypothetical protein
MWLRRVLETKRSLVLSPGGKKGMAGARVSFTLNALTHAAAADDLKLYLLCRFVTPSCYQRCDA